MGLSAPATSSSTVWSIGSGNDLPYAGQFCAQQAGDDKRNEVLMVEVAVPQQRPGGASLWVGDQREGEGTGRHRLKVVCLGKVVDQFKASLDITRQQRAFDVRNGVAPGFVVRFGPKPYLG